MSRTTLKLKPGNVTNGNNKQNLYQYITSINQQLGAEIPLRRDTSLTTYRAIQVAAPLTAYLNEHDYGLHEGAPVTPEKIDRFINRVKQEIHTTNTSFIPMDVAINDSVDDDKINVTSYNAPVPKFFTDPNEDTTNHFDYSDAPEPQLLFTTEPNSSHNDEALDLSIFDNNNNDNFSENQMEQPSQELIAILQQAIDNYRRQTGQQLHLTGNQQEDQAKLAVAFSDLIPRRISNGRAAGKEGMGELARIVLDLQRDIKRVQKAMSIQGAREMVEKHNAKYPENSLSRWQAEHRDINDDGIPDVLIKNSKGENLYVNGYTTTKSDWPIKQSWFNNYPTPEERKEAKRDHFPTMSKYAQHLFGTAYNDDYNDDFHDMGKISTYTVPDQWDLEKLTKYKGIPKNKDLSAFDRFKRYILTPRLTDIFNYYEEGKLINIPGTYKARIVAKVTSDVWNGWIVEKIKQDTRMSQERFDRWKKTKDGKAGLNRIVSELMEHLLLTNTDPEIAWTDEKRQQLNNELYNFIHHSIGKYFKEYYDKNEEFQALVAKANEGYSGELPSEFPQERQQHYIENKREYIAQRHHDFGGNNYTHTAVPAWTYQNYQHQPEQEE